MSIFGSWGRSAPVAARSSASQRPRATPTTESDWQRMRDVPRPQDTVLSSLARHWCDAMGQRDRPDQLCALYPRIANRLALCWDDPTLVSRVLGELVIDRRRSRAGFPPAVLQELMRLRLLRPSRAASNSSSSNFTPLWDASGMAIGDR